MLLKVFPEASQVSEVADAVKEEYGPTDGPAAASEFEDDENSDSGEIAGVDVHSG